MIDCRHHHTSPRDFFFCNTQEKRLITHLNIDWQSGTDCSLAPQHHPYHSHTVLKGKRKHKVVHFQEELNSFIPPLFLELSLDDARLLWYQHAEIAAFKCRARSILLQREVYDEDDDRSGLERFNVERSMRKKQTIHCVVQGCKKRKLLNLPEGSSDEIGTGPPDFVAQIYQDGSATATKLALEQGFKDFCQVYDPLASLLGDNLENVTEHIAYNEIQNYNDYFFSDTQEESITNDATPTTASWLFPQFAVGATFIDTHVMQTNRPPTIIPLSGIDTSLTPEERLRKIREKQAMLSLQIAANFRLMGRHAE